MQKSFLVSIDQRRSFLRNTGILAAGAAGMAVTGAPAQQGGINEDDDVSTNEDLMREHGVLKRVLLIYEEIVRRIHARKDFPSATIGASATVIRKFIEEYHEKLEEEHLFPRFRKAGKLVDLIDVLLAQHQAGRRITDRVLATLSAMKTQEERERLASDLSQFVRMYAPHEAREDTVLFPALHEIVSRHEYDALGEQFDKIERTTFGGDGFDIYLEKVVAIEQQLGIYDLAQFTPK